LGLGCINVGCPDTDEVINKPASNAMRSKDEIRHAVWSQLKEHGVARFPGAEGRIPNFVGAEACARLLAETSF